MVIPRHRKATQRRGDGALSQPPRPRGADSVEDGRSVCESTVGLSLESAFTVLSGCKCQRHERSAEP